MMKITRICLFSVWNKLNYKHLDGWTITVHLSKNWNLLLGYNINESKFYKGFHNGKHKNYLLVIFKVFIQIYN